MTEKLKTLLHERATEPQFVMPDLEALVREGDRRVRRRRAGSVAGALAVLALVGGVAATQLGGAPGTDSMPAATDPNVPRQVTWATGSVIHSSGHDIEVGHEVRAFAETSTGFVVADDSGSVWSVRGGAVAAIGRVDAKQPHLAADADSPWAGWVESRGKESPAFVIYNQATGDRKLMTERTTAGMGTRASDPDPASVYAIDGDVAYLREAGGAVAENLVTGERSVVDAKAANGFDIKDAQDGLVAFAADAGTALGPDLDHAVLLRQVYGDLGVFSPHAGYYSNDADEPQVYDARTGKRIDFDLRYAFATGYSWLDEHTVVMIAQEKPSSSVQLLTCRVPEGSCEVAVDDLGSFDDLAAEGFQLPVGEPIGG